MIFEIFVPLLRNRALPALKWENGKDEEKWEEERNTDGERYFQFIIFKKALCAAWLQIYNAVCVNNKLTKIEITNYLQGIFYIRFIHANSPGA